MWRLQFARWMRLRRRHGRAVHAIAMATTPAHPVNSIARRTWATRQCRRGQCVVLHANDGTALRGVLRLRRP